MTNNSTIDLTEWDDKARRVLKRKLENALATWAPCAERVVQSVIRTELQRAGFSSTALQHWCVSGAVKRNTIAYFNDILAKWQGVQTEKLKQPLTWTYYLSKADNWYLRNDWKILGQFWAITLDDVKTYTSRVAKVVSKAVSEDELFFECLSALLEHKLQGDQRFHVTRPTPIIKTSILTSSLQFQRALLSINDGFQVAKWTREEKAKSNDMRQQFEEQKSRMDKPIKRWKGAVAKSVAERCYRYARRLCNRDAPSSTANTGTTSSPSISTTSSANFASPPASLPVSAVNADDNVPSIAYRPVHAPSIAAPSSSQLRYTPMPAHNTILARIETMRARLNLMRADFLRLRSELNLELDAYHARQNLAQAGNYIDQYAIPQPMTQMQHMAPMQPMQPMTTMRHVAPMQRQPVVPHVEPVPTAQSALSVTSATNTVTTGPAAAMNANLSLFDVASDNWTMDMPFGPAASVDLSVIGNIGFPDFFR